VKPFDALLIDDPRLPEAARERRYSQMSEQIEERLKRDRRNRARAARGRARAADISVD
jgi:hypothetical protein